jgi:hypothetical protein
MLLQNSNAISEVGGYAISNSLRFQSASSQYLSRTFGTPTSQNIWTWSGWVKLGSSNTIPLLTSILLPATGASTWEGFYISSGSISYIAGSAGGTNALIKTAT